MIRPRDKGDVPDDPLSRMRHSASHVMADAVKRLRPDAKVAIGPSIETGFYYDFDTEPFAPEDAERIEAEMRKIIAENLRFEQKVVSRAEALELFRSRGEIYKVEIIESIPEGEPISFFQHGNFIDLCRGPHVERTGDIKAFKVLSFAGAYWRGDERNRQLQRVYGTAFPSDRRAQGLPGAASRRPSAATTACSARRWTCSRWTIWWARASCCGTPRALTSATRSRRSSGARTCAAATTWSTRRTWRASSCSRRRGTWRTTRRTCSAAWSSTASAIWSSR